MDLAIELLDRGEGVVSVPPRLIDRAPGGPEADNRVYVEDYETGQIGRAHV